MKYLKTVQLIVLIIGIVIVYHLIFNPDIGIHLLWNILIPIAPALLVVATGLWRNICPIASISLFPRHMGFSKKIKLSTLQVDKLNLIGIIILFLIVPLRHALFNTDGFATALLLISLSCTAFVLSLFFDWKSAWCSGLCPIYPVEKLYGINNKISFPNAHCDKCYNCVSPCPDSTSNISRDTSKNIYKKLSSLFLIGGLPGFIYGWFQIPDYYQIPNISQLIVIYKVPMLWSLLTMVVFLVLKKFIQEKTLIAIFAASAVSCYYWFRIPALFGFGIFSEDGMLIDLTHVLPVWSIQIAVYLTSVFFFWWIVFSKQKKVSWMIRPVYGRYEKNIYSNK